MRIYFNKTLSIFRCYTRIYINPNPFHIIRKRFVDRKSNLFICSMHQRFTISPQRFCQQLKLIKLITIVQTYGAQTIMFKLRTLNNHKTLLRELRIIPHINILQWLKVQCKYNYDICIFIHKIFQGYLLSKVALTSPDHK